MSLNKVPKEETSSGRLDKPRGGASSRPPGELASADRSALQLLAQLLVAPGLGPQSVETNNITSNNISVALIIVIIIIIIIIIDFIVIMIMI